MVNATAGTPSAATSQSLAFVFPGQASQRAGMAAALLSEEPEARHIFDQASEILGLNLAEVCVTGDEALLSRTDITQPALLTTCLAWHAALQNRGVRPALLAGHSLGEFSAWVASGVLDFPAAVRLVRRRGELMEEASRLRPGGMVAVIGLDDRQVEECCLQAEARLRRERPLGAVVVPANYNSPGQVVVSGDEAGLERVEQLVRAAGGKTIRLKVSGAFHSPLMEDAARVFRSLVEEQVLRDPQVPVVAGATGEFVTTAERAREVMMAQMTSPVRWAECVRQMVKCGITTFVEVGPGQVLTKLIQRTVDGVRCLPVGSPEELARVVEHCSGPGRREER